MDLLGTFIFFINLLQKPEIKILFVFRAYKPNRTIANIVNQTKPHRSVMDHLWLVVLSNELWFSF